MDSKRLLTVIRSSPLWWSSADLVPEHPAYKNEIEGLDLTWYFRNFHSILGPSPSINDCLEDYLDNAARLSRSPNMVFDESWYRKEYPEIDSLVNDGKLRSGWNHYILEGAQQFYNPSYWFSEKWYQRHYGEAGEAVRRGELLCGFEHFLLYGIGQDLSPSIYFNTAWYRRQYLQSDSAGSRRFPIVHYLSSRRAVRPCPTPLFDPGWYAGQYIEIDGPKSDQVSAYEHYLLFGRQLGYSPSPHFDERGYRDSYPEVEQAVRGKLYATGLEQYLSEGALNGLVPPSHHSTSGIDYAGPAFLSNYERSLNLSISQIAHLRELLRNA